MEYFDVVDEVGNPTGATVSREEAHAQGTRHRTAHIWIACKKPVDIRGLVLQNEEVESVAWFDLEETYLDCLNHDSRFCVPIEGLRTIRNALKKI